MSNNSIIPHTQCVAAVLGSFFGALAKLGVRVSSRADTSLYLPRGDIPSETILVRMTPNTLSMTP